jgi:hypothetical protein
MQLQVWPVWESGYTARAWACNPHRAVVHTPAGGPEHGRVGESLSSRKSSGRAVAEQWQSRRCRQPVSGTWLWPQRVWCAKGRGDWDEDMQQLETPWLWEARALGCRVDEGWDQGAREHQLATSGAAPRGRCRGLSGHDEAGEQAAGGGRRPSIHPSIHPMAARPLAMSCR